MLLNIGLTIFLMYRNWTLREKYYQLEDGLHKQYIEMETEALEEAQKYMDARETYERLIREYDAGYVPEGD